MMDKREDHPLKANDSLKFSIVNGKLVLERTPVLPDFTLEELLDQVIDLPEAEVDWGQTIGKETW